MWCVGDKEGRYQSCTKWGRAPECSRNGTYLGAVSFSCLSAKNRNETTVRKGISIHVTSQLTIAFVTKTAEHLEPKGKDSPFVLFALILVLLLIVVFRT